MDNKFATFQIEKLFLIGYALMLFSWMFENIMYLNKILPLVRGISYIIAIICILYSFKRFSLKRLYICLIFTIGVVISAFVSKNNILLPLCCFALASRFVDFNSLIKFDFKIKIIFCLIIIFCFLLGFSETTVFYSYNGIARNSLGFGNPNTLGYYIFSICADYIFIKSKKISLLNLFVGIMIAMILSFISISRTPSILIILLFLLSFFAHRFKFVFNSKLIKKILLLSFLLMTFFTISFIKNYSSDSTFYNNLNESLSGRIVNSYRYLEKYDFKLFGQEISLVNYNSTINLYLDNGYLKLLLNNGIVAFIFIFMIYYYLIKDSFKSSNVYLLDIIFIYLCYGLFENVFFWLTGNVFLLKIFCKEGILNNSLKGECLNGKN